MTYQEIQREIPELPSRFIPAVARVLALQRIPKPDSDILHQVCQQEGISPQEITTKWPTGTKARTIKKVVIVLMSQTAGLSSPRIAAIMGIGRTTVINTVRSHLDLYRKDYDYRQTYLRIRKYTFPDNSMT